MPLFENEGVGGNFGGATTRRNPTIARRIGGSNRKHKVYPTGRICAEKGCEIRLSIYNSAERCHQHDRCFSFPRIRGRV